MRVVYGIVEPAALLALQGLTHYEVCDVDDVAQLAQLARRLAGLEEPFGLLIEDVEAVPGPLQAQVGAHYANVITHDLVHFLHRLCDENHLLRMRGAGIVPFRHVGAQLVAFDGLRRVGGRRVGIYHGLYQRVGCQTVAAVQTGAAAFAHGI